MVAEIEKINGDIVALQDRMVVVSDWEDQAVIVELTTRETRLTQALTEAQRRLTSLEEKHADPKHAAAQEFEVEGPGRITALGEAVDRLSSQIEQLKRDNTSGKMAVETAALQTELLDAKVASLTTRLLDMKSSQSTSTEGLAAAQIDKTRLSSVLKDLRLQETFLSSEIQRLSPQADATLSIVDQIAREVSEKTDQVTQLDGEISDDIGSVELLKARVGEANQNITVIRSQMMSEFKPLLEFQNVNNQLFALELTIDSLDKEIDNLDARAAGAEGKLNRFIRACKRKPACKDALNL